MRYFLLTATLLTGEIICGLNSVQARPSSLSPSIADLVKRSADYILTCQLPDGLIAMTPHEKVWAVPYFANLIGLGLLRAYQSVGDRRYLEAVLRYEEWYIRHINPDGTIYDYVGTRDRPEPTRDYDSSDAYPATFLTLCWETYRITKDREWLKARFPVLIKCVEGIRLTWQEDGLTFGKPNYRVKYLMDNLEVRLGLRAAVKIARTLRNRERTKTWEDLLAKNRQGLKLLWMEEEGRFAMAMFEDGKLHRDFAQWYPDGMANAMALAYILDPRDPKAKALHEAVSRTFSEASDYWRFAALWKFGPRETALRVQQKMGSRFEHSLDHGHYLRALMPEKDGFFYREERLQLSDLTPRPPSL